MAYGLQRFHPFRVLQLKAVRSYFLFLHVTTAVVNSWPKCCVFTGKLKLCHIGYSGGNQTRHSHNPHTFNRFIRGYVLSCIMIVLHSSFAVINSHLLSPYSHFLSSMSRHVVLCGLHRTYVCLSVVMFHSKMADTDQKRSSNSRLYLRGDSTHVSWRVC